MKTLILGALLLFPQPEVQTTVIRSIKYENFRGVSLDEIIHRLKDRGVRVAVEQFYEPQQIEKATSVLQEFLEEKGRRDVQVKSVIRQIPPRSVEVKFTAMHN
jgi:outer membrane protein assembly factor BamA